VKVRPHLACLGATLRQGPNGAQVEPQWASKLQASKLQTSLLAERGLRHQVLKPARRRHLAQAKGEGTERPTRTDWDCLSLCAAFLRRTVRATALAAL